MLSLCMNIYLVDHFCIFVGNIFYIYLGHFFSANNKQCSTDNFGNGNVTALMEWHYYLYGVVVCSHSCMIHHYNLNVRLFSFASAIVRICCVSVCVCWFSPSNFFLSISMVLRFFLHWSWSLYQCEWVGKRLWKTAEKHHWTTARMIL